MPNHSVKFHKDLIGSFFSFLLTDITGENVTSLVEVTMLLIRMWLAMQEVVPCNMARVMLNEGFQ